MTASEPKVSSSGPSVESRSPAPSRGGARAHPVTLSRVATRATPEAKRRLLAVLSVLGGELRPKEAADSLGMGLPRYYLLESRGFEAMRRAFEPSARGPARTPEREAERLTKECARLQRESERLRTLLRLSRRAVGMLSAEPPAKRPDGKGKGKRRRRPSVRVLRLTRELRNVPAEAPAPAGAEPPSPEERHG